MKGNVLNNIDVHVCLQYSLGSNSMQKGPGRCKAIQPEKEDQSRYSGGNEARRSLEDDEGGRLRRPNGRAGTPPQHGRKHAEGSARTAFGITGNN